MYDTLSYIALMIINYLVDVGEPSRTKTFNFRKHDKKHVSCTRWQNQRGSCPVCQPQAEVCMAFSS